MQRNARVVKPVFLGKFSVFNFYFKGDTKKEESKQRFLRGILKREFVLYLAVGPNHMVRGIERTRTLISAS